MVKATITMNDHTVFEHKFKSSLELKRWMREYAGEYTDVQYKILPKEENPIKES